MKIKFLVFLIIPFLSFGQAFICHKGEWPNCHGEFEKDGDKHYGVFTIKEGKIWSCKEGKVTWSNDSFFEGEWRNGEKWRGNGIIKFTNGGYFEGEWKNGEEWSGNGVLKTDANEVCNYVKQNGKEILLQRICNNDNQYNIKDLEGPAQATVDLFKNEQGNPNAFYMNLVINSQKVKFHFDTGCSSFNMNLSQWEKIDLDPSKYEDLEITSSSDAVGNNNIPTHFYKILEPIQLDEFSISNVIVSVVQVRTPEEPGNDNLLGIGFLKKFSNVIWNMEGHNLILER